MRRDTTLKPTAWLVFSSNAVFLFFYWIENLFYYFILAFNRTQHFKFVTKTTVGGSNGNKRRRKCKSHEEESRKWEKREIERRKQTFRWRELVSLWNIRQNDEEGAQVKSYN